MKEIWRENTIQDLVTSKEGIIKCRVVLNTHLHLSWGDSESCNFFPHHLPLEFCKVTPVWSPPSTQINETWQWDITDRLKCFEQILYEFRINLKWCEWYTFFCVCVSKRRIRSIAWNWSVKMDLCYFTCFFLLVSSERRTGQNIIHT